VTRLDRLRERLDLPLLVTAPANVLYLTGLHSSNAALVVEPERTRLFTDFRYVDAAREVDGVEVVETRRALFGTLAEQLEGRIAFEADAVTYTSYRTLADGGIDLVPRAGVVEALRAVKDETELGTLRRAAGIADAALAALVEEPWIGRTERELAWQLEQLMREGGADRAAFETMVGAGPDGAHPHLEPGDRVVERGTTVVVDFGCVVDGYSSDCTRTFATGDLPEELAAAYEACLAGQLAAVRAIRAGMTGVEADAAARTTIAEAGFGERFGHGLGHGVGLLVHEAPRLSAESQDTLEPGNVVTIEPGVYLPGVGGVRIEDLAVVRGDGVELLTSLPKELTSVS
jgi:Xaa-Pro aminopeptidase